MRVLAFLLERQLISEANNSSKKTRSGLGEWSGTGNGSTDSENTSNKNPGNKNTANAIQLSTTSLTIQKRLTSWTG